MDFHKSSANLNCLSLIRHLLRKCHLPPGEGFVGDALYKKDACLPTSILLLSPCDLFDFVIKGQPLFLSKLLPEGIAEDLLLIVGDELTEVILLQGRVG